MYYWIYGSLLQHRVNKKSSHPTALQSIDNSARTTKHYIAHGAPLCPSYLHHHFGVKLVGAKYLVIFPTLTLRVWGTRKVLKTYKQKMKIIEHFFCARVIELLRCCKEMKDVGEGRFCDVSSSLGRCALPRIGWIQPSGDFLQAPPREGGTSLRNSFSTTKLTLSCTRDSPGECALARLIPGGFSRVWPCRTPPSAGHQ